MDSGAFFYQLKQRMLTFYSGSQLEPMVDTLVERLREPPLDHPLEPETIVVQNHGMARWLSTRIAGKSGIAANFEFPFPGEIIWKIYRAADPDIPEELPSDREPMIWTLYRLLEKLPEEPPYRPVWRYMRDETGEWSPVKAWKLAGQIADLFDKYLNYRQEMLLKWSDGVTVYHSESEAWQAGLWIQLEEIWKGSGRVWWHQAQVHREFMERLEEGNLPGTDSLPERVTLFGLSRMQPSHIEVFLNISRLIKVHWFRMDPVSANPDHPLARSWGEEGREFQRLLKKYSEADKIAIADKEIKRAEPDTGFLPPVSVHSCHSPLREVEVLHDRLLELFENDPDLAPDDILIMTPDIETHAPFIEAVFGTAEKGVPDLPFHIVDEQSGTRKEVFRTFSKLLDLLESRFKVTEVLDLLSGRPVLDRFEISESELERLTRWIRETNIRWGLDDTHKRRLGLPDSPLYTWQYGLDRMLLGYASLPEDELFEGVYPLGAIESSDDAELLGKLSRFLSELRQAWHYTREEQDPGQWAELLEGWMAAFIPSEGRYHRSFQGLSDLVAAVRDSAGLGGFQTKLPYPVLREHLNTRLRAEAGRGGYFGHGITFSGLDPMRSIPFEVIGLIGMNSESFPRNRIVPDFDLMSRDPREGDRIPRMHDRYLFLETIRSAGKHLHLSYVGQSDRDDSARPPSVMISELLETLADRQGKELKGLTREHPLQAHSADYFRGGESDLFSYSQLKYAVSRRIEAREEKRPAFWSGSLPEADDSFSQVDIAELVRFFENPSRYLLQQRLGLYLGEGEVISEEREPFELGGLDGYRLGEELIARVLDERDTDGYEPIARARGWLPEGWIGRQAFGTKSAEASEIGTSLGELMDSGKRDPLEFSLEAGELHLTGVLDSLYGDSQLFFRYGDLRAKDLIRLWIYHLALRRVGRLEPDQDHPNSSVMVYRKDKNNLATVRLADIDDPGQWLNLLADLYRRGISSKMPFFADSSYHYAREILLKGKDHEAGIRKAMGRWEHYRKPELGEGEDPYIKRLFVGDEPIESQEFIELSKKFWKPVFNALVEGGNELA